MFQLAWNSLNILPQLVVTRTAWKDKCPHNTHVSTIFRLGYMATQYTCFNIVLAGVCLSCPEQL